MKRKDSTLPLIKVILEKMRVTTYKLRERRSLTLQFLQLNLGTGLREILSKIEAYINSISNNVQILLTTLHADQFMKIANLLLPRDPWTDRLATGLRH